MSESSGSESRTGTGWLDRIERLGNALPDPTTLFLIGALVVVFASAIAVHFEWSAERIVSRPVAVDAGALPDAAPLRERVRVSVEPVSLLSADGVYWMLSSMVKSFVEFPPLGVVLVGMLGIGVAEKSGFIGALLKAVMLAVPVRLLSPTMVFVGIMSSMGLDAGYVVLPPIAAALYQSVGRSPLVGLAAVFAGVSAGFGANLMVTSLDPLLAGLSTEGAQLLDPQYRVAATANLWFMIVSTLLLTLVGWGVTALWVEPRFAAKTPEEGGPRPIEGNELENGRLDATERRGLFVASAVAAFLLVLFGFVASIPGAPLQGLDGRFPRWVIAIVPVLFLGFLIPGLVYGIMTGSIKNDRDAAQMMSDTMAGMGSYIVLAFFAAQFIAYFRYTGLGEILAIRGGQALAEAALPPSMLMLGFIGVVMLGNIFIGSMSAKYAFFAPVFVPMFMQVGISPELTQVAYRVGDSVTNVVTPLNPYIVIVLVFMKRFVPTSGLGTLVALMLPYTVVFAVAWSLLLIVWMGLGVELGPAGPLEYHAP